MPLIRKTWRPAALALIVLLIVLAPALMQRDLLYVPPAAPAVDMGMFGYRSLIVESEPGLSIRHWIGGDLSRDRPVALMLHGNAGFAGDMRALADALIDRDWAVVLVEYRGFAGQPGKPTEQGLYQDARSVIAHLQERGIEPQRMLAFGYSLGSGVAVQMATEVDLCAVGLIAPFTSIRAMAQAQYPWLPVDLLLLDRFDNDRKLSAIDEPVLIVHGLRDTLILPSHSETLAALVADRSRLSLLPDSDHLDLFETGAVEAMIAMLDTAPAIDCR